MDGIGAMLHVLGGGSENSADKYYGKKIIDAKTAESPDDYNACGDKDRGALLLAFEGGPTIRIWDNGQSCCENRYMTTDDNPADLIGQTLVSIQSRDGEDVDKEYGEVHETCFVIIQGDKSAITLTTHNENNGYYGGFGLTITEEK